MADCCPACGRMYRGRNYDRAADLIDEIEMLLSAGQAPNQIARRLGITPASVGRRLTRWGRRDLARPFWRADWQERTTPPRRRLQEAS